MRRALGVVVWLLLLSMGAAAAQAQTVVKMGTLADMTGPTSDVGKDIALGMREAVQYVNDTGGINGKPIKMFLFDYGYRVQEAITTYKRFRDFDKVVAVWGWGTGDTEALSPTVNADRMPFLSDSFSSNLTDPKKTPYNFIYGTDYSTNARAALTAWYDEVWLKEAKFKADRDKGARPRFVAFYSWPVPYSSAPIKAIKDQAALLGFEVGPDQDISLTALDTKSQVLAAKSFGPHVVWHGNTTMSVATALKDAAALGLGADHLVNIWGYDENLIKLAGTASERVIGTPANAFYGEKVPLMDKVVEYTKKINPNVPQENRLVRTVQSWVDVLLMREALVRADKAGKLFDKSGKDLPQEVRGPAVKEAFESIREWTPGLARAPITITPADHRPGSLVRVYVIRDRKFTQLAAVDLKKRWPEKWDKDWLGW
jgi:branched-chain amino acid transport system substrate-binding protein